MQSTKWHPLIIPSPTPSDIFMACAGLQLGWILRYEHRTHNTAEQLRIWPLADWRTGPGEFVKWLTDGAFQKGANAKSN